jgi:DNA-directed RNA polymerase subunit H (RpoH/RPB5)
MASKSSNRILSIYKSRKNILDLLEKQGYNVDDNTFSINEVDTMYVNSQLDLLISHSTDERKVYVKYLLSAKIRPKDLDEIIEDLFVIENVLKKTDTLVIIVEEEPNDTIITKSKYLFDHDDTFVVLHNISRLQYNILQHKLIPKVEILNATEVNELKQKYNLKSLEQLPEISRFDPLSLALFLRPGQVCRMVRSSATALSYDYYRHCM